LIFFMESVSHLLFQFLVFTRQFLLVYNFPTNPVTGIIYFTITYYGYTKLKQRFNTGLKPWRNNVCLFIYSLCLIGFINFLLENVWLTCFYLRCHLNNIGNTWITLYFPEPWGWVLNYARNLIFVFCFSLLIDHRIWKVIHFNVKTYLAFLALSLYIVLFFFLSQSYAWIDWSYALAYDFDEGTVIRAFLIGTLGKPLFFYLYSTIW